MAVVRLKYLCSDATESAQPGGGTLWQYSFAAVSDTTTAAVMTAPAGNITLSSIKSKLFEVGSSYYFDISKS